MLAGLPGEHGSAEVKLVLTPGLDHSVGRGLVLLTPGPELPRPSPDLPRPDPDLPRPGPLNPMSSRPNLIPLALVLKLRSNWFFRAKGLNFA